MNNYNRFKAKLGKEIDKAFGDISNIFGDLQGILREQPPEVLSVINNWRDYICDGSIKKFRRTLDTEDKRMIFNLIFDKGLSYEDASKECGMNRNKIAMIVCQIYKDAKSFDGLITLLRIDPSKAVRPDINKRKAMIYRLRDLYR